MEEARLYVLKHFLTHFANESVIVLALDVHYEFFIVGFSTLS